MKIQFFNRGLLQLLEEIGVEEKEVKEVRIGESTIIVELKNGDRYLKYYQLSSTRILKIK